MITYTFQKLEIEGTLMCCVSDCGKNSTTLMSANYNDPVFGAPISYFCDEHADAYRPGGTVPTAPPSKQMSRADDPVVKRLLRTLTEANIKNPEYTEIKNLLIDGLGGRFNAEVYSIQVNRRYGHSDACKFGWENSGFCDCGKGFLDK